MSPIRLAMLGNVWLANWAAACPLGGCWLAWAPTAQREWPDSASSCGKAHSFQLVCKWLQTPSVKIDFALFPLITLVLMVMASIKRTRDHTRIHSLAGPSATWYQPLICCSIAEGLVNQHSPCSQIVFFLHFSHFFLSYPFMNLLCCHSFESPRPYEE